MYNDCCGDPRRCGSALKHVDIFVGEADRPECEYPRVRQGMHVHVDGLETYEQVKELVGFVHGLANTKYIFTSDDNGGRK